MVGKLLLDYQSVCLFNAWHRWRDRWRDRWRFRLQKRLRRYSLWLRAELLTPSPVLPTRMQSSKGLRASEIRVKISIGIKGKMSETALLNVTNVLLIHRDIRGIATKLNEWAFGFQWAVASSWFYNISTGRLFLLKKYEELIPIVSFGWLAKNSQSTWCLPINHPQVID